MITAKFGVPRLRGLALTSPMSTPRYVWRQLNQIQREELLSWRKERGYPWHSPPHRPNFGHLRFLISAACFEHHHYIGHSAKRMDDFSRDLLAVFAAQARQTFASCVLPNHYHALVEAPELRTSPQPRQRRVVRLFLSPLKTVPKLVSAFLPWLPARACDL